MDYDWTPHGTNGCGIKVEWPIVVFPGRHGQGNVGLEKEIQGELCLGKEEVPQIVGEAVGDSGKNEEEMRLEGADGALVNVTAMDTRGHELELCPPLIFDVELVGCTVFFVKYLEIDTMAALDEAGHDSICGGEAVAVVAGFEWLHQDDIGFHMVG